MKKLLILSLSSAVFAFFAVGSVSAQEGTYGYGTAGCGLGALIFKDKPGFIQVSAATTNGTYSNQSSGITSGTSNCTPGGGTAHKMHRQEIFAHVNFESLQQEMAVGQGEKLAAFATLLGCPAAEFGAMTRKQHDRLFAGKEDPSAMLAEIRNSIRADKALSRSCKI